MKFLARSFLIAGVLLVGLLTMGAQNAPVVPTRKTVLVLSPFQPGLSTNLIAAQAMREGFGKATNLSDDAYYEFLDLNRFPIVKDRQYSYWELYLPQILVAGMGIVVLLLLLLLVVYLLGLTRRLNRTRLALAHLNVSLETQVQERTSLLNKTNSQLQDEITERKKAEEQLRESEEKFRSLLDSQESNIMMVDFDGVHHYVNQGGVTSINSSGTAQDIIGKRLHDLYPSRIADWQLEQIRQVFTTGQGISGDFEITGDDQSSWWQLNLQPIRNASGQVAQVMVNSLNITKRKRAEEQLRETHNTLQTIIYSSPLAILALDPDDHVTMWNPAAEAMFGWSDKQILGQANPTVPENKFKEYDALRQATLNGMAFSNLDTLRMRKDGTQFPVSLSVAPLRGQQGQVIGRMHVISDITERKKLQEELRQQATTDELTKVSNRRHFLELGQNEIKRAVRFKRFPAIALIDIDHFKEINDTFGHAAGDRALVAFTKICQKQIREIDIFARFGGDEFVLLLPETNQEQAYVVVERVRKALTSQLIDLDGNSVALTISSGISSLSSDQESIDTLLSQADQALYRAKEAGRNNVVRYDKLCK